MKEGSAMQFHHIKIISFCAVAVLTFCFSGHASAMELFSQDFKNNQQIPAMHTCDGSDTSPQLSWSNAPAGTKSFALTCIDPDAPSGDFIHWFVFDIPASITNFSQGAPLPAGSKEVENDFGRKNYGGPCPPSGTHRYIFTLYALKKEKLAGVTRNNFLQKVRENELAKALLIGLYKRR
jgi:Raf kinase inhibitor-like YbhB/YbcL family protein